MRLSGELVDITCTKRQSTFGGLILHPPLPDEIVTELIITAGVVVEQRSRLRSGVQRMQYLSDTPI